MVGPNNECMKIDTLPSSNDATKWLATLENRINRSLIKQVQDCIDFRVKNRKILCGHKLYFPYFIISVLECIIFCVFYDLKVCVFCFIIILFYEYSTQPFPVALFKPF